MMDIIIFQLLISGVTDKLRNTLQPSISQLRAIKLIPLESTEPVFLAVELNACIEQPTTTVTTGSTGHGGGVETTTTVTTPVWSTPDYSVF